MPTYSRNYDNVHYDFILSKELTTCCSVFMILALIFIMRSDDESEACKDDTT